MKKASKINNIEEPDANLKRFRFFNEILTDNDMAHSIMAQISDTINSGKPFFSGHISEMLDSLFVRLDSMAVNLEKLTGKNAKILLETIRSLKISTRIELIPKIKCPQGEKCEDTECLDCDKLGQLFNETPYILFLNEIDGKNAVQAGNKMARLGELKNRLELPVPEGFCLTIRLFDDILSHNNLRSKKNKLLKKINFNDPFSVQYIARQIQAMIISSELPGYIENYIMNAYNSVFSNKSKLLAVRSSAFGEDSELHSFAGLHKSILNVPVERIIDSAIEVLASFYSPQSVTYRYLSGIRDEDMPMSVGCIEMVDAKAAGVLYTNDPHMAKEGMIIQAIRGLGSQVVDGTVKPQEYLVSMEADTMRILYNGKEYQNTKNSKDSCLKPGDISALYRYAIKIRDYYGVQQDIEWALSKDERIWILQARPLKLFANTAENSTQTIEFEYYFSKEQLLIDNGECASGGTATGVVFLLNTLRDLDRVPDGAIVVARSNFIELTSVIHKIAGIVTDVGSTTGHLSIIARELKIPLLTNTVVGTSVLTEGEQITLFSGYAKVYRGVLPDLAEYGVIGKAIQNTFIESPVYTIWSGLIRDYFALHLVDIHSDSFRAENCTSIHDLIRYIHELTMRYMFMIKPGSGKNPEKTYKLKFDVPIDLSIIDLGNGVNSRGKSIIGIEDILSKPMMSLIEGMSAPGIQWSGFVNMDSRGLAGIVLGNITSGDIGEMAENIRSYAFISDHYINFFSQLGFHFSRLDAMATDKIGKNYINVNFRGGASTNDRTSRRAESISLILEQYGFSTFRKNDDINARIKNIPCDEVLKFIEKIGRLMGAIRNADVLMSRDEHIEIFSRAFLDGDPAPALKLK